MLGLSLQHDGSKRFRVLCLGAHSDDIEIGCGGTILLLQKLFPQIEFHWVVLTAPGARRVEAEQSAALFSKRCEVIVRDFRDGFLPYEGAAVKDFLESLKTVNPDLIFTHWREDAHQDHRLTSELTRNTFRNHLILEYEVPKYDGDLGRPTIFIPLESDICEQKTRNLMDAFPSQRAKNWFTQDTFRSLLRLRGIECNAPSGYAEAFHSYKAVLALSDLI